MRPSADLDVEGVRTVADLAAVLRQPRRRQARRRQDSPLTYRELAARTGWAHSAIGDYFAGHALPPTDRFDVLVQLLGASAHEQGLLATARDRVEENRRGRRATEPAAAAVPWELPGPVRAFVGREGPLAELDALLAENCRRVVITAMAGTAGVGKTALAVHWAHQAADAFPDGCLHADLRGYATDEPVRPEEALAEFLRSLGVDGARVPTDLPGLVARDGAQRVELDLLPEADAVDLLRLLIGKRAELEPQAAVALAQQCARLPLALRIAAELAVSRPAARLEELVGELAGLQRRLDLLDAGGDPDTAVRGVFSWSYQALPAAAARAFLLIGTQPGVEVDAAALAALVGGGVDAAGGLLDELFRAHLVQRTDPAGAQERCRMHDLLRGYAIERAAAELAPGELRAALTSLFEHQLGRCAAAMDVLYPHEWHRRPAVDAPGHRFGTAAGALAWLDAQRANLAAAVRHAAEGGWYELAWRLAQTLWRHLDAGGHHATALAVHTHALRAARAGGDGRAVATALLTLGTAYTRLGRYPEAVEHYERAHDTAAGLGERADMARALNNLGNVCWRLGRYADALDRCAAAIVIYRELGDLASVAGTLTNAGLVHQQLGHLDEALGHHRRALAVARELGDRLGEVHALVNLGVVFGKLGEHADALASHRAALDLAGELGDRTGVALALVNLALAHLGLGEHPRAVEHLERALAISRETGDRDIETDALNTLGEALRAMRRPEAALARHEEALAVAEEFDDRLEQARSLDGIAHALAAAGQHDRARHHWQRALAVYTELGVPEADEVRTRLLPSAPMAQGR